MPARGLRIAMLLVAVCAFGVARPAAAEDVLRPPRGGMHGACSTLADLGEKALERLPWDTKILRANLSAERPVAVSACYLMQNHLLVISQTGLVYCMDRRDLTPRWVSSLRAPLAAVPGEGPTHYAFLVKATDGAFWIHAFDKRSGAETRGFPTRLPFASSSGLTLNGSRIWVGSLGSPRDNKTVESVSLADGRVGWGWRTRGLLWASPAVDVSGGSLILSGEDGTMTSLPAGGDRPTDVNWTRMMTGAVTATPVLTPEHIVVGCHDGTLRCLDLASGEVTWLQGLDAPLKTSPWVVGSRTSVSRSVGVEGAPDIQVQGFTGIAFARNLNGLYAFDLTTGKELFQDAAARRPVGRAGKWVLTMDGNRTLVFRDAESNYDVKARLPLQMFDLVPTNSSADGAIYGCTHDGAIVAAIPSP